ncbi:hypothetical protein LCGC14_1913340, partial [marine sediment metagenome]
DNLHAMCAHASSMCHKYWISTVSRSRVHVGYSNPDEHGKENPMYVVLPSFPSPWPDDKRNNPRVLIEPMRVINDTWNGEGHQAFDMLWNHYANRGPSGWDVVECDPMGAASRASMVAQHIAYHDKFDDGKRCQTCEDKKPVS